MEKKKCYVVFMYDKNLSNREWVYGVFFDKDKAIAICQEYKSDPWVGCYYKEAEIKE